MSRSRMAKGSVRLVPAAGPLRIAVLAFPDVQILDIVGPAEVFSIANRLGAPGAERYAVQVVAPKAGPLATSNGLAVVAQRGLAQPTGPIDTLVVAGGPGVGAARRNAELIGWIRRTAAKARRVASVCTGAFLLAEAGLLDGRRATTHWARVRPLAQRFPTVEVERDPIFVRDGNVYTSAGVTAGMDLALALVEEDLGREVALERRPLAGAVPAAAGRPVAVQRAARRASRPSASRSAICRHSSPTTSPPISRSRRSRERARMSPRNFARAFTREVGMTPAALRRDAARVEAARRRLEASRRTSVDRRSPPPAASAPPRPCAGPSCARCASRPAQYRRHFRGAPRRERRRHEAPRRQSKITHKETRMNIAIPIFEGITALDAIGPYEVLSRLPGARVRFVGHRGRRRTGPTTASSR